MIRGTGIEKRQSGNSPPHGVAWRYVPGEFGLGELVLSVLDIDTLINNFELADALDTVGEEYIATELATNFTCMMRQYFHVDGLDFNEVTRSYLLSNVRVISVLIASHLRRWLL